MKKKSILGILILTGALTVGVNSKVPTNHNLTSENHVLLVGQTNVKAKVSENNAEGTNPKLIKAEDTSQNLTKTEVSNLKDKTIKKHGMVFKGVTAMKIAPNMTNSFLATPGFDADGFASTTNEQLYNYELNLKNDQKTMGEAIQLHDGNPIDTCVFFQSTSLRAIGQTVPNNIGYTTHLENWLKNNGWTQHSDFAYVQKGDLCFASYYHTFLFMGWKDKAKGVAWVMGNESFVQPYYRRRNLNGQSPQIYGDNSYTGATVYWTKGAGYEGPGANPLHRGEYNAFGTVTVKSQTSLYQNQGSGTVYSEIPVGINLPVLKSDNGWYEVYYNGNLGWVNSKNTSAIAESMGGGIGTANTVTGSNIGGPYKNIQTTKYPSIGVGVIIANGGLWLNAQANTSNPIKVIPQGANVSVIAQSGKWDKIQYYGQVGWVDANPNYIQTMMSPKTPSPAAKAPAGSKIEIQTTKLDGTTVVEADIYLNNEPKATYDGATSICIIPNGTKVDVLGKSSNNWFKVVYKGQIGYISAKYTNGYTVKAKKIEYKTGWQEINGQSYYINNEGNKEVGWNTIDGSRYYFNNSGIKQIGWLENNGSIYYMGYNGAMTEGFREIFGSQYYFNTNGIQQIGWLEVDGSWYYMGYNGEMQTGFREIFGSQYYFNTNGVQQRGWETIDGSKYYFNANGIKQIGWLGNNDSIYYMGYNGVMTKGWREIFGSKYYFNNQGKQQIGWLEVDGSWYYMGYNGEMQTGWREIFGSKYYFNTNGIQQRGWKTIDGSTYYFNGQGIVQTGSHYINGKTYTFNSNGVMI